MAESYSFLALVDPGRHAPDPRADLTRILFPVAQLFCRCRWLFVVGVSGNSIIGTATPVWYFVRRGFVGLAKTPNRKPASLTPSVWDSQRLYLSA